MLAEQPHRLVDGGKRGVIQAPGEDVVEADDSHLLWHAHPGLRQGLQHADGHLVVRADYRIGQ